jgi:hypothetical protein
MLLPRRRSPLLPAATGAVASRRDRRRRPDEVLHVGRMPRTDTFSIGAEVLPRPRDELREPRGPAV